MSTLLTEAQLIVENRAGQYGDTRENMQCTADLWNAYFKSISVKRSHVTKSNLENFLTEEDIPQMMILFKIAREIAGHKRDNLVDIAGYADVADRVWEGK